MSVMIMTLMYPATAKVVGICVQWL